jgi:glycosyltransferase involved in cell wall biosynthesis
MKIAVVHDYFTQLGGAEKVAEELYKMLPSADLYATVALRDKMPESIRDVPVRTSWMQHLPQMRRFYRMYFPLYPFGVSSLDLSQYELVVSSSSGYVKGVRVAPDAIHVCYCHTPMRWVWSFDSYSSRESFGQGIRALLPTVIRRLRAWDEAAARQPDHFVANSRMIAARILRAYGRHAEVIAPPIDIQRFSMTDVHEDYYIVLARLVAYKRIDLAVEACTRLGRRLIVIGSGTAQESLARSAGPTVKFVGRISDEEVERYVSSCRALLFPGEEDFGMAPIEVAAAGRPTIAYGQGGALETIIEDETGLFFREQSADSLMDAILRFEQQTWNPRVIRAHAEGFSTESFQQKFLSFLRRVGADI